MESGLAVIGLLSYAIETGKERRYLLVERVRTLPPETRDVLLAVVVGIMSRLIADGRLTIDDFKAIL